MPNLVAISKATAKINRGGGIRPPQALSVSNHPGQIIPLNKNSPEAEIGRGSYMVRFMYSAFLIGFKNSLHSDEISSVLQKTTKLLNKNSKLKICSQEFFRILKISPEFFRLEKQYQCLQGLCFILRTSLRTLQAGI